MKKLLLLIPLVISLNSQAQTSVYFPLPDSAVVWRQEGYNQGNCCCSGAVCLKEDDYQYFLDGDTTIGASLYKKIFMTGNGVDHILGPFTCPPNCNNGTYSYYNNVYSGGLRQDIPQRKVYYVRPGLTQEVLIYDFDLNIGDTLPPYLSFGSSVYVTAIDSILVGGLYHKRFEISGSGFPNEISLIEGIGNSLGLLSPFLSNLNVSLFYNMLLCVTVNGVPVYPDTATVCSLASQINEVDNNLSFSINPNPFSDKINIATREDDFVEFVLNDISGRKTVVQSFKGSISINTELLASGIYIYDVRNKNRIIGKGKMIKY